MFCKDATLKNVINIKEWQKTQDCFSEALNITLRAISLDGELLSKPSLPSRLCAEISADSSPHSEFCRSCILKNNTEKLKGITEITNLKCFCELDLFVLPIAAVGNKVMAHLIVGPVILNRRKGNFEYAETAEKLGIKFENLIDILVEISVFTHNKIHSINKLLTRTFSYMVQTGYHKRRLGEITPEIIEMDPLFSRYYEEKILSSMLNVCMLALDTDSGSIMTMDQKTQKLHIKVASKLDDDVVHNTNIKLGEGIAGVAAAKAEPIILPNDQTKDGLSGKMKRNYIKSSMIVPFPKGQSREVYGVINLNVLRKNRQFSKKDIALVQELLNLASTALIPFQQKKPT